MNMKWIVFNTLDCERAGKSRRSCLQVNLTKHTTEPRPCCKTTISLRFKFPRDIRAHRIFQQPPLFLKTVEENIALQAQDTV